MAYQSGINSSSWQSQQYQSGAGQYANQGYGNQNPYGGQQYNQTQYSNTNQFNQGSNHQYQGATGNNSTQPTGKVSSETSDPNTAHMRLFVGNINTQNLTKEELYARFSHYGNVTAVSLHRGFAFVQLDDPTCARSAVKAENGNMIAGQKADINIAAEPKPNQKQPDNDQNGFQQGGYNSWSQGSGVRGGVRGGRGRASAAARGVVRGALRGVRGGAFNRGRVAARGMLTRGSRGRVLRGQKVFSGRVTKPAVRKPSLPSHDTISKAIQPPTPSVNPMPPPPVPPSEPVFGSFAAQYLDLKTVKKDLVEIREKVNALILCVAKAEAIAASVKEDQEEAQEQNNGGKEKELAMVTKQEPNN
ncbi:uncharacterized protein LOC100176339 [Ciona intestinalis]